MKESLFLGTTSSKIDTKNRVSIPASFRSILVDEKSELILYPSFHYPCLEACSSDVLLSLVDRLEKEHSPFDIQKAQIESLIFASAKAFTIDSTGRISLVDNLISHAHLANEAAFVGCGKSFQIWNPDLWEKEIKQRKQLFLKEIQSNE